MNDIAITLLFADGATHQLRAQPGDKLTDAAAQAGLTLLTDCANGQCGTCAAQRVSGNVTMDGYDSSVLPDDDRDSGAILCCVSRVKEPCIIELPYDASEASASEAPAQLGRVHALEPVAEDTVRLEVDIDAPLNFLPGQYVRLRPEGQTQSRSYSMANAPGQTRLVFYVRIVAGGMFSRWLQTAAPGAAIEVSAPRGSFFLRDDARPRLFVAGGTGLAPFLAMLRAMEPAVGSEQAPTRLLVGVRSGRHLFAEDEIAQLKSRLPWLDVEYAAEADAAGACHTGYATDLILSGMDPSTRIYLCGPPPMVEAGRAAAARAGIRKSDMLCERFA